MKVAKGIGFIFFVLMILLAIGIPTSAMAYDWHWRHHHHHHHWYHNGYGYNNVLRHQDVPANGEGMIDARNPNLFWACDSEGHHCHWEPRH